MALFVMTPAAIWLLIWMVNNIGVTLLNKAAFAKVNFKYPWFLSAIHMACNYLGCWYVFYSIKNAQLTTATATATATSTNNNNQNSSSKNDTTTSTTTSTIPSACTIDSSTSSSISSSSSSSSLHTRHQPLALRILGGQQIQRKELDTNGYKVMIGFSILFTLNIAIGNVSLKYVSVNFNQVMRSLVPAVTIALGICMGKTFTLQRIYAVVPIMIGVAMACFGDMTYTTVGFIVTALCVVLAALKAVAAGEMLTGSLKLHPVDLLGHMAPMAFIQCLFVSIVSGEVYSIAGRWNNELNPFTGNPYIMFVVWMSGFASFTLNISSLQANKLTSPLTLCIAANVKQVLMIWLGTVIFDTPIPPLNLAGIVVVLIGSARYSYVCISEKPIPPTPSTQISNNSAITTNNNNNNENGFVEMNDKDSERPLKDVIANDDLELDHDGNGNNIIHIDDIESDDRIPLLKVNK